MSFFTAKKEKTKEVFGDTVQTGKQFGRGFGKGLATGAVISLIFVPLVFVGTLLNNAFEE